MPDTVIRTSVQVGRREHTVAFDLGRDELKLGEFVYGQRDVERADVLSRF